MTIPTLRRTRPLPALRPAVARAWLLAGLALAGVVGAAMAQVSASAPAATPAPAPSTPAPAASLPHPSAPSRAWQAPAGGPAWTELTAAQRDTLAPLASEWNRLDADSRQRWMELAGRFPHMKPDAQARLRARMVEWARMTPQQRGRARLVYQEYRGVSKAQRQAAWQRYQALPPDKKKELAQRELARRTAHPAPVASAPHGQAGSAPHRPGPSHAATPGALLPRPVAPAVVQARPGATTTLVNRTPAPTRHPVNSARIAVDANDVDRTTLLPRKGPQRAGLPAPRAASSSPAPHPSAPPAPVRPATAAPSAAPGASHP